ncbi:hypothetical protein [Kitasatospora sp. NPDC094011]
MSAPSAVPGKGADGTVGRLRHRERAATPHKAFTARPTSRN